LQEEQERARKGGREGGRERERGREKERARARERENERVIERVRERDTMWWGKEGGGREIKYVGGNNTTADSPRIK